MTQRGEHVLTYGAHKGSTVEQAFEEKGAKYLKWLASRARKTVPGDAEAIEAFLEDAPEEAPEKASAPVADAAPAKPHAERKPGDIDPAIRARAAKIAEAEAAGREFDPAQAAVDSGAGGDELDELERRALKAAGLDGAELDDEDQDDEPARAPSARKLLEVVGRFALIWPDGSARGGRGTRVWDDDPFLSFETSPGSDEYSQLFKCRECADPKARPTPLRQMRWASEYKRLGYDGYTFEQSPGVEIPVTRLPSRREPSRPNRRSESPHRQPRAPATTARPDDLEVPAEQEA